MLPRTMETSGWTVPSWAIRPRKDLELAICKEGKEVGTCDVSRSGAYVFGRNTEGVTCGAVTLDHDSISRRHAALVHDMQGRVHLIDLGSRHGTRINGVAIAPRKYCELALGASLQFGASTRTYILRGRTPCAPEAPAKRPVEPTAEPAEIDLAALRRLGPAARAKLTPAEQRALALLATLDDDEDPLKNYVDDPEQDLSLVDGGEGALARAAPRAVPEGDRGKDEPARDAKQSKRKRAHERTHGRAHRSEGKGKPRTRTAQGDAAPASAADERNVRPEKRKHDKKAPHPSKNF